MSTLQNVVFISMATKYNTKRSTERVIDKFGKFLIWQTSIERNKSS